MSEEVTADDIRNYWKRWLDRASDEQVFRWHQTIVEASDPNDLALDDDYQPRHLLGYYLFINEWLTGRGFEAESAEQIDKMDLPPDVRQRAEQAEITPSA